MQQELTMGSLFSGSGGFELASAIFGIEPRWASEIEPLPMLITKKNFPDMPHHGDIRYMNGGKVEAVTVIAGGSPCQDMSVAGQRAGLDGSRSNLFHEQIRIIKEMREHDRKAGRTGKYIRQRFMVWENVPGAFSSNKGKDFQAVLQAIVSVTDDTATVPLPPKGKWQSAGCIMGDTYSIAWRTLDAQYWGVPQRRKRIYLVADFGGGTAPKILFEREGLSRDFAESREAWQRTAGDIKEGTHKAGTENVECYDISDRRRVADKSEVSPTLTTKMGTGGNNVPIVLENHPQDCRVTISEDGVIPTLTGKMGARCYAMQAFGQYKESEIASAIKARDFKDSTDLVVEMEYIIRRLTPLECCRLQGFPDDWTEDIAITEPKASVIREWMIAWAEWWRLIGKDEGIQLPKDAKQVERWLADPASDSGLYKMWGNGIALPCAMFVMEGIAEVLKEENSNESE